MNDRYGYTIKDTRTLMANASISQFMVQGNCTDGFAIFFSHNDWAERCAIVPTRTQTPRIFKSPFTLTKCLHQLGIEKWTVNTTGTTQHD